jgi:hypothetical protein
MNQLPTVPAPVSLWSGIEASLAEQDRARRTPALVPTSIFSFLTTRPLAYGLAATLLVGLVVGGILYLRSYERTGWAVARLEGAPVVGNERVEQAGSLRIGDWLETDSLSRAIISVGLIGQVEVGPNTRIRLVRAQTTDHRLALARGKVHATIWAPPRLFFVETPSAVAVDLGCAYTLEVDEAGNGYLQVTSGWVALELAQRESMVPAGARCQTRPGKGPGTPYFEDATEQLQAALAEIDFGNGGEEALETVLAEARVVDTLTLWHLLFRVGVEQRGTVYDRMAALVPPPDGVTRDRIMRLDREALDRWKNTLEDTWLRDDLSIGQIQNR